jgi:hypothetical protein
MFWGGELFFASRIDYKAGKRLNIYQFNMNMKKTTNGKAKAALSINTHLIGAGE